MVSSFYMDQIPVTNTHYVEFLNRMLPKISVENAVVRGDVNIWMFLGEVTEGYEPIIFKNNKFSVKNPSFAKRPVVRVTAYGALAYARYYGKRLPTVWEWLLALQKGISEMNSIADNAQKSSQKIDDVPEENLSVKPSGTNDVAPSVVSKLEKNQLGIRGINQGLGEWGIRDLDAYIGDFAGKSRFVILGAIRKDAAESPGKVSILPRFPWEAFEEVGFRTVIDAQEIETR